MKIFSVFNQSIQNNFFIPLSQTNMKGYRVATGIFHQLKFLLSAVCKNLRTLTWTNLSKSLTTPLIIESSTQPLILLDKVVDSSMFIPSILSRLAIKDLCNLLQISKSHLNLLKDVQLLNYLFSNSTISHLALASLVKPYIPEVSKINFKKLTKGHIAIIKNCPKLTSLNLSACKGLTDTGLQEIIQSRSNNLTHLDLYDCSNLTDAGLQAIAQNCPNLIHLNLSKCNNLTDAGLQAIAQNCPNLIHLNLSGCNNVTDAGLQSIAQNCRNLKHLNLSGVKNVTDASLKVIAKSCCNLTSLELSRWSEGITNSGQEVIIKNCSKLTNFNYSFFPYVGIRKII